MVIHIRSFKNIHNSVSSLLFKNILTLNYIEKYNEYMLYTGNYTSYSKISKYLFSIMGIAFKSMKI